MAASGDPVPVRASPVPASYDRTQAALEDMRRGRKGGASACARYWDLDEQQFRRAWKRERDGGVWTGSGRPRTLREEDEAVLVQWVKWHALHGHRVMRLQCDEPPWRWLRNGGDRRWRLVPLQRICREYLAAHAVFPAGGGGMHFACATA